MTGGVGLTLGMDSGIYRFIWDNVYGSLSSTMFALSAFFIFGAYRSLECGERRPSSCS